MSMRKLVALILATAVARLLSLGVIPLTDTTEARYGAIARTMAATGDWVTPWFPDGGPFWGKPPLAFWLSAAAFRLFGVNEFAARLPHWLLGIAVLWLVWDWTARYSERAAWYAVAMLVGSVLFFVSFGTVMTDTALLLGVVLGYRGFWLGLHEEAAADRRRERLLLFAGIAVGLLAKGPIVLVLTLIPFAAWSLMTRRAGEVWREIPWGSGALFTLLLVVPWYALAEMRTPGFLEYFIVGEHILRFLVPGWNGDLYGNAHSEPYGMIWAFMAIGLLPWLVLIPPFLVLQARRRGVSISVSESDGNALQRMLLIWGLTPAVFFTAASNILPTYALPGLPGLAMVSALWLARVNAQRAVRITLGGGLVAVTALFGGIVAWHMTSGEIEERTEKYLVETFSEHSSPDAKLVYLGDRPFSAAFYAAGEALMVNSQEELAHRLDNGSRFAAVKRGKKLNPELRRRLGRLDASGNFVLYEERASHSSLSEAECEAIGYPRTRPAPNLRPSNCFLRQSP